MATKIKILAVAEAPALQVARTLKWVQCFVNQDPADVWLKRINQYCVFQLISKKDGKPAEASQSLREQLESQEVELIDD